MYDARDAKDQQRGQGPRPVKCKCWLCRASIWSVRQRNMANLHLCRLGHHPFCRGPTEVINILLLVHGSLLSP